MRAARKPSAVARELLRNFPKSGGRRRRRKRKGSKESGGAEKAAVVAEVNGDMDELDAGSENGAAPELEPDEVETDGDQPEASEAAEES